MAKEKEIIIDRWDLGITDQERDLPNGYFKYLENINTGDSIRGAAQNLNATKSTGAYGEHFRSLRRVLKVGSEFWALGSDGTDTVMWSKEGTVWTVHTINANYALDYRDNAFFVYDNGYLLFHNNEKIGLYKISGDNNNGDFLSLAGGLHGGIMWQGYAYGHTDNKIYKIDVGNYTDSQTITEMVTIPSDQTIVQTIDYGNFMAIICTSTTNESLMYIWDGVTTTTFFDIINIGRGTVTGGVVLEGLITIAMESSKELLIKQYNEVVFQTIHRFSARADASGDKDMNLGRVKEYNGYMYILAIATRPAGTGTKGTPLLLRYGRRDVLSPVSFCVYKYFDYTPTTTSDFITDLLIHESVLAGVRSVPSYFALVTEDDAGTADAVMEEIQINANKAVNVQVGIIETGIYTLDASIKKKLTRVNVQLAPLPADGQVLIKYRKDEETSWTTIATLTTDNTITNDSVNIEATGVNLPSFYEIAFRIELSGGAEITRLKAKYEDEHGL